MNVSRNNNLLTVAGSLSNSVTSLTINGQTATVYHDLTWAVPGGITLANGSNLLTAVVGTNTGGVRLTNSLVTMLPATVALRYDADGNLTWDGLLAYTYDCADELTAVTLTNGWKTGYVYDGLGRRRIRKDYTWTNNAWAETNEVHYVYDGMNVIQERNANNVPLVTYTRGVDLSGTRQGAGGIGGLLARTDANGPAYYHDDANGNVTALVNGSGTVVAKYLYDSFGNTLGTWGSLAAGNTYRFSSKEMDARTGQYYYGYRWYDPNLQRWLNRDPIQELGGINLYGFVGNDTINKVDPWGWQYDPNSLNALVGKPPFFAPPPSQGGGNSGLGLTAALTGIGVGASLPTPAGPNYLRIGLRCFRAMEMAAAAKFYENWQSAENSLPTNDGHAYWIPVGLLGLGTASYYDQEVDQWVNIPGIKGPAPGDSPVLFYVPDVWSGDLNNAVNSANVIYTKDYDGYLKSHMD